MSSGRHALIVATDTYEDEGLEHLLAPGEDAVALAGVLGNSEIGGFGVEVVRNGSAYMVSRRVEDFFADRSRSDSLLLHFSCHGLKNASGQLFFAAADTLPQRLSSSAVSADFVRGCMAECRARNIVLLLDCCYGGAFMEGMVPRAAGDVNVLDAFSEEGLASGHGYAVITASNAMEYAFEGTRLSTDRQVCPSVFTRALTSGLASGEADLDADGRVSVNELYDYVYERVRQENPHQTPSRSINLQGDVYLARSSRRRTGGEGLPEELRLAVSSPEVFSRRGAVTELCRLLQSQDGEVADAACRALHGLVRNDIRSIADEASQALAEVTVRPSPERLDFGRVSQYESEPHRRIQLLGPLLARDCVPRPHDDWIHVSVEADAFDVSVDTRRLGNLEGTLTLEGRTGDTDLPVTVEVLPAHGPAPVETDPPHAPEHRRGQHGFGVGASASGPRFAPAPPLSTPLRKLHPTGPVPEPESQVTPPGREALPRSPDALSLAGVWARSAARVIDYGLVFLFALGAVFVMLVVVSVLGVSASVVDTFAEVVLVLFFLGWGVLLFLYDWLFLRYRGATFGKMLLGLRVVSARDGGPLSHGQAAGRAALFGLPQTIPLLGHLLILFECLPARTDPWKRAGHDRRARTLVLRTRT
ncbi:caspase, EACC1-associated type [Nocardiopsis ganjiahuensis]|uniref:caspase, EACC1-associated type n=1 Tax=Nocardiopsis ganjiahuensis TaxID=239984 RepID=UPI0003475822|nr:RDD family protein [Nocardiopsis ganjiahuensis]